jgi:signal recognition particle subunit SEC65
MPNINVVQDVQVEVDIYTDVSPFEFVCECDKKELAELVDVLKDYGYTLQEQNDSFAYKLIHKRPHAKSIIEELEELIVDTSIHASKQDIIKHIINKLQEKYKV